MRYQPALEGVGVDGAVADGKDEWVPGGGYVHEAVLPQPKVGGAAVFLDVPVRTLHLAFCFSAAHFADPLSLSNCRRHTQPPTLPEMT